MSTTAIILAAGKGTRMKSDLPKVLHEVCDRPMLAWVVDACRTAGCDRLIVVVGHKAEMVKDAFRGNDDDIVYVTQEPQLGTGHAVMVCKDQLATLCGAVLVVAGDGPLVTGETLGELLAKHREENAAVTLATCILDEPGKYGRVIRDESGDLDRIVEAVEAEQDELAVKEVNVSLYCYDAESLMGVIDRISNDNNKGEYYLTDTLALLKADGRKLSAVAAVPPEQVVSINTLEELQEVSQLMAARMGEAAERQ